HCCLFRQDAYGQVLTSRPRSQVSPIASNLGIALMIARYRGHRSERDVAFAISLGLHRMLLAIRLAIERHIAVGGTHYLQSMPVRNVEADVRHSECDLCPSQRWGRAR